MTVTVNKLKFTACLFFQDKNIPGLKLLKLIMLLTSLLVCKPLFAKSIEDLEYGVIIYEYYQQNYFAALIEHEYAEQIGNSLTQRDNAQVLNASMMLSYGLANEAKNVFELLLNKDTSTTDKNRAWFYLAKLYHQKNDIPNAAIALQRIKGTLPKDIHQDYHYLATLINISNKHMGDAENIIDGSIASKQLAPYLLYNLAIGQVKAGDTNKAIKNLNRVTNYTGLSEEHTVLSDRAKHSLALLSMQKSDLVQAWAHLQSIRTTGLYSNRALLSYGWAAIGLKQYEEAIPALKIINDRSISIPEVQEAKVLLPHLYEQNGAERKALKGYLLAEKAFDQGLADITEARRIIASQDVPEEFVTNLKAVMDDSDWYGTQPSIDYQKLTPFLLDLMASHAFRSSLKELGDLYAIRKNLLFWKSQAAQHELILNRKGSSLSGKSIGQKIADSSQLYHQYKDKNLELRLQTRTLKSRQQDRFVALLDTTKIELEQLEDKISQLSHISKPYQHSKNKIKRVSVMHKQINAKLALTDQLINTIEPIMRRVVSAELNKHEERMKYYSVQAKLAKARLYDSTLLSLEKTAQR